MSTKDFSNKQEKMIADYLGWSVVSGSGARACHPGDIIGEDWLGECKTHETTGKSIFFSTNVWTKICEEATFQHRRPVLFTDDGSQNIRKTWCLIPIFTVEDDWSVQPMKKKFRANFTMNHEDLAKLYDCNGIQSGNSDKVCYYAEMGSQKVVVLPLELFKYMFD